MSGTMRSGAIFAIVNFVAGLAMGVLFPICFPFCGLVIGGGAGYLGFMWSEGTTDPPARVGATAGAISGVGALIGVVIGSLISYYAFGEQNQQIISDLLGTEVATGPEAETAAMIGAIGTACCIGIGALVLGAAGGAGGAAIRNSTAGGDKAAAV